MKFPMCTLSSIVDPGTYFVVTTNKEHVSEVKHLEESMTVEMLHDDTAAINLHMNMCVAVFFHDKVVRGLIKKKISNNLYEIMLMDYGHCIRVKKSAIRIITNEDYLKVEPLAFIVKLYGLIPARYIFTEKSKAAKACKDWGPESEAFVKSFFMENLKIVVQSILIQQRTVYGDLFVRDESKKKYVSLRKLLCENEFCAYSETVFLRNENLNIPSESVEMETKMEMVEKWQQENFGQPKENIYQLPSLAESPICNVSDVPTLNLSGSKSSDYEVEKTAQRDVKSAKVEEISTSSFVVEGSSDLKSLSKIYKIVSEKFVKGGCGRGKLKLLIAEMKIKEQASAETPAFNLRLSDSAESRGDSPKGFRGRGQVLRKYLKSIKGETLTETSHRPSFVEESKSIKEEERFSEACGGDISKETSETEIKSEEQPGVSKIEKAVVKPGEFSEFSDSNGFTEVSLSIEEDTGPPPLVRNCTVKSNLDVSKLSRGKSECKSDIVKCEKSQKNVEDPKSEFKKDCESFPKEEMVNLECSELKENEEDWCAEREKNIFELREHPSNCWTPFVLFDDSVVESVNTFRELPIQPSIIQNLEKGGSFNNLSQVQRWAIPAIRKQHNTLVIGSSKTGKTLSYLIPLIDYVQDEFYFDELPPGNGPSVVIVASSSRVCESIHYVCHSLLGYLSHKNIDRSKVKVVSAHGGCEKQVWVSLTNGCDILISTPHCLVRLLEHSVLTNFERLACLVLDEIDVIAQNPFKKSVRIILEKAQLSTKGRYYQKILCGEKWTPHVERVIKTYVKSYALIIGSYQEAVMYEGLKPTIVLVDKSRKAETLLEKLKNEGNHLKVVIFCETNAEAISLKEFFSEKKISSMLAHENLLADKLQETEKIWKNSRESILIMTDGILNEFCIREAQILIHYGLPSRSKTNFFLRFSTVLNFYGKKRNFQKAQGRSQFAKVIILVDDENNYQLPHITEFVTRLGGKLPERIIKRCEDIQRVVEIGKSTSPICGNLMSFGRCRNSKRCPQRHAMTIARDSPEGLPTDGWVSFAIVKTLDASLFSATLLTHTDFNGEKSTFENSRLEIQKKVTEFFKEEGNKRPHGVPKIGDVCGVKHKFLEEELFYRARVVEYLKLDKHEMPLEVSVKLIDEGDILKQKNMELYELPEELAKLPPTVVDVRVVGVQPLDFDVSWNQMANDFVEDLMMQKLKPNQFWSGKVVLALKDTLFLDPIKRKEFLPNLNVDVFDLVVSGELLNNKIAVTNNEHLVSVLKLCKEANMELPKKEERKKEDSAKVEPQWAFFDSDLMEVKFLAAENVWTIFLQPKKYEKLLETLEEDCQKVETKTKSDEALTVGKYCLARFEDGKWNRGRIESEKETQFEVFFIDHGDFLFISKDNVSPIPQSLLLRLPSQAIECRLVGVEEEEYPIEVLQEIYFFSDDGKESLLARIVSTESKAVITNGRKYNVSLFNKKGVSLSKMLVDSSMVRAKESERCHLENIEVESSEEEEKEEEEEKAEEGKLEEDDEEEQKEQNLNIEKEVTELKETSLSSSLDGYLRNLKDEVFEDEDALEFLKEFASKLFPKLEGFQEIETTRQEEEIFTKAITSSGDHSDSPKKSNNPRMKTALCDIQRLLELKKKRQSRQRRELELRSQENVLTPQVLWSQNQGEIRLKILLGNVSDYSYEVTHSNISFRCLLGEKFYAMDVRLFGAINPEKTRVITKAFHVSMVLTKLAHPLWPRLHLDEGKHRWISLDVEGLKDEKNELMDRIKTAKQEIEDGKLKEGFRSEIIEPHSESEDSDKDRDKASDSDDSNDDL